MTDKLTFVSVVFDAEVTLLELQARSMRMFLAPDAVDKIIVLDNCLLGLGSRRRARLLDAYGVHAPKVSFVPTRDLFDPGATSGWRSQQAAKLLISSRVRTPDYIALDAKNHFTRPVTSADFVGDDGRARGRSHPYDQHPLRSSLVHTIEYLGGDKAMVEGAVRAFPPTATPFVLRTSVVQELIRDIEESSGRPFAVEFEDRRLLEFFLYSGWATVRGPGLPALRNESPLTSPTVWPKAAHLQGVEDTIAEARDSGAFVFAVHRQALAHADRATLDRVARHWVGIGLFRDVKEVKRFLGRFKRSYTPALALTRSAERIQRLTRKIPFTSRRAHA
ncbi:DUF6492 family protein [Microbacterium sp. 1P10UB]|uniref:DUF6492 family protein n=1 Tax=unclassified Microbacterium TaxID=2609290 RepID=UPI0039A2E633